jgi:hydrogenase nickel incorporation protein HypB
MCATCGCSSETHQHDDHDHHHDHDHDHHHDQDHHHHDGAQVIDLERRVLARNDHIASHNRADFARAGVLALNLLGSPGAGKTSLLERTIREAGSELGISVIEGDQATARDADRVRAAGARAVQVQTGAVCHLDAQMVARASRELAPVPGSVLFLENVGNLVCPALFDLGEAARVVLASVTEGDDKPAKYPHMFRRCDLLLIGKIDLLPHLGGDFDLPALVRAARQLNPAVEVLEVSARSGQGMPAWIAWLRARRAALAAAPAREVVR